MYEEGGKKKKTNNLYSKIIVWRINAAFSISRLSASDTPTVNTLLCR